MADRKVTALDAATAGDLISTTLIMVVNPSQGADEDKNRKMTLTQLGAAVQDGTLDGAAVSAGTLPGSALENNAVTYGKFQDMPAYSALGRVSGTTGDPQAIVASARGQLLKRGGAGLEFGLLELDSIPDGLITGDKIQAGTIGATNLDPYAIAVSPYIAANSSVQVTAGATYIIPAGMWYLRPDNVNLIVEVLWGTQWAPLAGSGTAIVIGATTFAYSMLVISDGTNVRARNLSGSVAYWLMRRQVWP